MPSVTAIIPARYESQRFPGKVLAAETGKPLIQYVFDRARDATTIDRVIIATDSEVVRDAVNAFGADVIMTAASHENGTSRIAEVAASIGDEIIVNVQADEPEIEPALIDDAVNALRDDEQSVMSTVASPFAAAENVDDPNIVKVVVDTNNRAMYFSRSVVPFPRDTETESSPLKHVGLYVFRRAFLLDYVKLSPTPAERAEKLEQLRVLEHGYDIAVAISETNSHGIDTPEQYAAFVKRQHNADASSRR